MPFNRATFFFKDDGEHGWTETIHSNKADLTSTLQAALALLPLRVDCLGATARLTFIRVSDDLVKRDSLVYQVPTGDQSPSLGRVGAADIANTSLVVRLDASPLTRRTLYMRGVPDSIIQDSGQYRPGGAFRVAFDAWVLELINNGWSCRSRIGVNPTHAITSIIQNVNTGKVTIGTVDAHGVGVGQGVVISGVQGANAVNGTTTAQVGTAGAVLVVNSNTILPAWSGGGVVTKLGFSMAPIVRGQIMRASHRNSGRFFDSPRGRRSAKKRV